MLRNRESGAGFADLLVGSLLLALLSAALFPALLGLFQNGRTLSQAADTGTRIVALRLFLDNWVSRAGSGTPGVRLTPLSWITAPDVSGNVGVRLEWAPLATSGVTSGTTSVVCTATLQTVRLTVAGLPVSGLLWQSTAPTTSTGPLCHAGSTFLPLPTQSANPYPWRFSTVSAPGCRNGQALVLASANSVSSASTQVLACLPNL